MGLSDLAREAVSKATDLTKEATKAVDIVVDDFKTNTNGMTQELKNMTGSDIVQGVLNNYNEVSFEQLQAEYGMYLMDGETITTGYKLVRDALIFTDKRIIFTDRQGVTGTKMSVESINLFSVVDVSMETAGFGLDDSELTFTYIKTPNLTAFEVIYASKKLEFPKTYNVQPLYKRLQELAYNNCLRINNLA